MFGTDVAPKHSWGHPSVPLARIHPSEPMPRPLPSSGLRACVGCLVTVTGPSAGHQAHSGRDSREESHIPCLPEAKFPTCNLRSPAKGNVTFT